MSYCRQTALPTSECVALADMKQFLRVTTDDDDSLITGLIQAAREVGEALTDRALARRTFVLVLDSFPYFTDSAHSQLAYPPNYYALPRYSTTLWNYSQMMKLPFAPCVSVQNIAYIDGTGTQQTLEPGTDFVVDITSEPARIFPPAGGYWPPSFYIANSVEVNFTAGYDPNVAATPATTTNTNVIPPDQQPTTTVEQAVPQIIRTAILQLVAYWYENRGEGADVPEGIRRLFLSKAVIDFSPTRG